MKSPLAAVAATLAPSRTAVSNDAPVPYATPAPPGLGGSARGWSGLGDEVHAMGAVPTLFAIVDLIAVSVSRADWRLYRTSVDGRRTTAPQPDRTEQPRTEVTRHLALQVWNSPNPHYSRQLLTETGQQHFELTGEEFWLTARPAGSPWPTELWPVRPDRMEPVPHPTDFLSGFVYHGPGGEQIPLGTDEVLWIRRPDPADPYRSISPVKALRPDLESVRYSAEWNSAFFRNSAEPGGIIQIDGTLDDREFQQLRMRWNEQHRGVDNAHRVAILEQGQWVDRKYTQRDMQFSELRDMTRDVIREAYGIHKHMLGGSDDVNRANSLAASADFARWVVAPRLERIKQTLNNGFLPLFGAAGQGVEFDYDSPVPADREADGAELSTKVSAATALMGAGGDPSSVLEALGLPDIDFPEPTPAPAPAPPPDAAETGSDPQEDA